MEAAAVAGAHAVHATALHDATGSARAFLGKAALPAVRALNLAGAPMLLPAMHRAVNSERLGLLDPKVALFAVWMEWRPSSQAAPVDGVVLPSTAALRPCCTP